MKSVCSVLMAIAFIFGMTALAGGNVLLDVSGKITKGERGDVERFPFEVSEADTIVVLEMSALLWNGAADFRVFDPRGKVTSGFTGGGRLEIGGHKIETHGRPGVYHLEVKPGTTYGKWNAKIYVMPRPSEFLVFLMAGGLMILIALASVFYWRSRTKIPWRWFWAGAGVWAVGVALKSIWAFLVNEPVLTNLERLFPVVSPDSAFPHVFYLLLGSTYIGSLTGVFEIGVTLAAALIWRNMCRDADTAIAVGIGAGAFEALLLGLSGLGGVFIALLGIPGSDGVLIGMARIAMVTPLAWLVGPVERVIAILCHTSSRALVLLSVAKRRGRLFWWGFVIMTAIDSIAGFVHISYMIGKASLWWIELAIAPFGIISVPIIRRCLGCWPSGR